MLLWLQLLLGKLKKEEGQGMVEYALLIGLIAVVVIVVLITLGDTITDFFQSIIDTLTGAEANTGTV